VVLVAGWAAFEVRAHARHVFVGGCAGKLELDIVVELVEALVASQLRSWGAEESREELLIVGLGHEMSSVVCGAEAAGSQCASEPRE
jgi:hypothetical protein